MTKYNESNADMNSLLYSSIIGFSNHGYNGSGELLDLMCRVLGTDYIVKYCTLYPEIYQRILSISRSRNMFELRTGLELSVGKDFYEKREELKSSWESNYGICDTMQAAVTYVLNSEDDLDWKMFYNICKKKNNWSYHRSYNSSALTLEYKILANKNPKAFESIVTDCLAKNNRYKNKHIRSLVYSSHISSGNANKKFIRKMRSETSGESSLSALKSFVEHKSLYPKFDEWITQFNDSKHEGVVNYLQDIYTPQQMLGLLGNPLANKNIIHNALS